MRPFLLSLSLPLMWAGPLLSQKAVSANFIALPLFFEAKQDLMGEINYELFDSQRKAVRLGVGFGFRNKVEQTITGAETTEFSGRYAAVAVVGGIKFYPTNKVNRGLFGALLCQFGFAKEKLVWRHSTSGLWNGHDEYKLNLLFKMGPILGYTLMMNKHWLMEPEIGYLLGKKREIIWPGEKQKSPVAADHFHLALNIGRRF